MLFGTHRSNSPPEAAFPTKILYTAITSPEAFTNGIMVTGSVFNPEAIHTLSRSEGTVRCALVCTSNSGNLVSSVLMMRLGENPS